MKRKNIFYTIFAVALLVTAALLTNCLNPIEGGIPGGPLTFPEGVPADKGVALISIGDGRSTILPDDSELMKANMRYNVVVELAASPFTKVEEILNSNYATLVSTPIPLNVGTYTIHVFGYTDSANTVPSVVGKATPVNIEVGVTTETDVWMKGIADGEDTGTFEYKFTFLGDTAVAMRIQTYPGFGALTPPFSKTNITSDAFDDSIELDSGYYMVTYTTSKTGFKSQVAQYMLHIYPGLVSKYTFIVPSASGLVEDVLKVNFHASNDSEVGKWTTNNEIRTVTTNAGGATLTRGDLILKYPTDPTYVSGSTPGAPEFRNWYKTDVKAAQSTATQWSWTIDRVFNTTDLYAGYGTGGDDSMIIKIGLNEFLANAGKDMTYRFYSREFVPSSIPAEVTEQHLVILGLGTAVTELQWYFNDAAIATSNTAFFDGSGNLFLRNNLVGLNAGYAGNDALFTLVGKYTGNGDEEWISINLLLLWIDGPKPATP
jgi:hypothetical protein